MPRADADPLGQRIHGGVVAVERAPEFERGDVARVVALVFAFTQAVFAFAPAILGLLRDAADAGWAPLLAAAIVQVGAAAVVLAGQTRRGVGLRGRSRARGGGIPPL